MKNVTSENRREFFRIVKIVLEWNDHLEIFNLPQVIENSRQYLLLRTDILQKTVVGCPCEKEDMMYVWLESTTALPLLVNLKLILQYNTIQCSLF